MYQSVRNAPFCVAFLDRLNANGSAHFCKAASCSQPPMRHVMPAGARLSSPCRSCQGRPLHAAVPARPSLAAQAVRLARQQQPAALLQDGGGARLRDPAVDGAVCDAVRAAWGAPRAQLGGALRPAQDLGQAGHLGSTTWLSMMLCTDIQA